jgi:DnaK suppressor protein
MPNAALPWARCCGATGNRSARQTRRARPPNSVMTIDIEKVRKQLEARKAELTASIENATESAAPVELDQQVQGRLSRMDAIQGQAMAQATIERRRIEIAQIDAAFKRMEQNEFGYCVECGDEIAPKRLELNPAIARCVECAD